MQKRKRFLAFLYENNAITKGTFEKFSANTKYHSIEELADELLELGKVAEDDVDIALRKFYGDNDREFLPQQHAEHQQYFQHYILLEEIGSGGMGKVYKALDTKLNREIALKIAKVTDDHHRFLTEVNAVAKLQHPNIINVYDVGKHQGFCYYTMQYISGKTLTQVLREGIDFKTGIEIFYKIVNAIDHIHQKDIIHRDLKPDNIILSEKNEPIVIDFGLIKKLEENSQKTTTAIIVGTPCYMSPEQASGQQIGKASDIFSLGVILYEMLTGVNPFFSENISQTLLKVSFFDPPSPRSIYSQINVHLETICTKCIEKQPHKRYVSACELAKDIHRFQNNEIIHAKPASIWRKSYKFIKRNKLLVAITTSIAFIVVTSLLSYIFLLRYFSSQQQQEARAVNIKFAQMARQRADQSYKQSRWREAAAYSGVSLQYLQNYEGQDVYSLRDYNKNTIRLCLQRDSLLYEKQSSAMRLLHNHCDAVYLHNNVDMYNLNNDKLINRIPQTDLTTATYISKNGKWLILHKALNHFELWDVQAQPSKIRNLNFASAGTISDDRRFIFVMNNSEFFIYDLEQDKILCDVPNAHFWREGVAFSKDLFAYGIGEGHDIVIRSLHTAEYLHTLQGHQNVIGDAFFSHDGKMLISGSFDGTVRFWDVKSGKQVSIIRSELGQIGRMALSHSGQILAIGHINGYISFWDLNYDYQPFNIVQSREITPIEAMSFSKNDARLYTQSVANTVSCWRVFYKQQLFNFPAYLTHGPTKLTINHSESILAFASLETTIIKLWNVQQQKLLGELSHSETVNAFDFHPQNNTLLSAAEKKLYLWDATSQQLHQTIAHHPAQITTAKFSPVHKSFLASGDSNGNVILYDFVAQKTQKKFTGGNEVTCICFSANGKILAFAGKDIELWDLDKNQLRQKISRSELPQQKYTKLEFYDPQYLIIYTDKGNMCIWGIYNKKLQRTVALYGNNHSPKLFVKELHGVISDNDLRDFVSGRTLQTFISTWTTIQYCLLTPSNKVIMISGRGKIRAYQLPTDLRYHAKKLPSWAQQFPQAIHDSPRTSPFDFRKEVPGWFIEKALEESPQKITEILFATKVKDDLKIEK